MSSSSEDDEVWDEIIIADEPIVNGETHSVNTNTNTNAEESMDIEISIQTAPRKKKAPTKYEKQLQIYLHESLLLFLLAAAIFRNAQANSQELQARLYSLVPGSILSSEETASLKKQKKSTLPRKLQRLLEWFMDNIGLLPHNQEYSLERTLMKPDLLNGISRECAFIYFVSLMRSCGYDSRLIASLHTFGRTTSAKSSAKLKDSSFPLDLYADVLIDGEWTTIDVLSGDVGDDVVVKDAEYVVAIANSQNPPFISVKDITRKFVERWSAVVKKREEHWWSSTLWLYSEDKDTRKPHEERENKELVKAEVSEKMPTTITGFLNHPLFVLERHLKVNEGIYPKEKKDSVGLFKEELVFPRKLVHVLFTAENWKRKGRQIPHITVPYKTTTSKGKKETVKQWFGDWQTVDWSRPKLLEDNVIPTNDFGNIEIFHELMIPEGCVHLRGPIAKKVAKKLDIEFVQACVDFEHSRGRSFPLFDGIIIHEENEEALRLGIEAKLEEMAEEDAKKKQKEVFQRWKKIITGLLLRQRLQNDYGS